MFKDKITKADVAAIIKFAVALPLSFAVRAKHKDIWLFSERPDEARDNGFVLYEYIRKNALHGESYYVINPSGCDAAKVEKLGNTIAHGSLKHYIYYCAATKHISAHVGGGMPQYRVANFLETHSLLRNKHVFLQHGVIKDTLSFCFYDVCRADILVTTAHRETEFCEKTFGFPDGNVKQLGIARLDRLHGAVAKKQILLMPTWRASLSVKSREEFRESAYFKAYSALLKDERLLSALEKSDTGLVFFPHSDMRSFTDLFESQSNCITVAKTQDYEVQTLLKESAMLITDYSSVAFDTAYMGRPVCYYHFDYDDYRKTQHPEGYFSYVDDGFGPILTDSEALVSAVCSLIENDFENPSPYKERAERFFDLKDSENCKRNFEAVQNL